MNKPEIEGYLYWCSENRDYRFSAFSGDYAVIRLTDHEAAMTAQYAAIVEWSGTAVQNGMECDRLAAERNELLSLLRDIHNGIHCDTLPGNLYQRIEMTLFSGDK